MPPTTLRDRLQELAGEVPPLEVPADLRQQIRRRQAATIAVTTTIAIALLVVVLTGARGFLRGAPQPAVSPTPSLSVRPASGTGTISVAGPGSGLGILEVDPVASPGADPARLVDGRAGPYAWSRDGSRLLFVRLPTFDLWVLDDGSETRLTTGITVQDASWSPDARQIVLAQDGEIDVMNTDG